MKKMIPILALLLLMTPAMGQMWVTVTGYVTDSATGAPIVNYPVSISSDSSAGFVYYNTVYTTSNGYYADSIWATTSWGLLYVRVWDCIQVMHQDTCNFAMGNEFFSKNFSICYNNTPTCDAEFTWNAAPPLTVYFTDLSTNPGGNWFWSFGDGSSSTTQHPVHTYPAPGTYTVGLTIGDSTVCSDYISHTVVVQDSTGGGCQADFYAVQDSNAFQTYSFFDQSVGNIVSWYWDFGDGQYSQQQNPTHTYAQSGYNYLVCLTVQGSDSLCYDTHCDTIYVSGGGGGCQAQFTWYPDSIPAQGYAVQFLDLSSGTPVNWYWEFGDSAWSTEQNPLHIYSFPGTYYVCLTIQCQGVTSTWCAEVEITNTVNCVNYFTYQPSGLTMAYQGYMVYGQPADYSWNFGDGMTGTGQSATHTYASAGIYYVTLSTVDSTGCQYTSAQSVMVGDSGQYYQVYGQVFANNFPVTSCLVMLFGVDTSGNYFPFVDVAQIDSMGVYYFPMVPTGSYYIYAIPMDSAGYLPTYYGDVLFWPEATIVTLPQPTNPYDIHLIPAGLYTPGPGNINGQVNTGDFFTGLVDKITMQLMDETYTIIGFAQVDAGGAFHFPQLAYGTYFLHGEMAGCTSDLVTVEITEQNPDVNVVMTYAGGQILGVRNTELKLDAGDVYPNPARDAASINITLENPATLTAVLLDLTGREVYKMTKQAPAGDCKLTLPVNDLNSGVYMIRIISDQGISATKKLVISR